MTKTIVILLIAFSCVYPIEREYQNGFSFYLGFGDMLGNIGANAEYQIQIKNTHFSVSPFLGAGWTGAASSYDGFWLGYSGGILGEYGNKNKLQTGVFISSRYNLETDLAAVLGYHLITKSGFTLFFNGGIRYGIINSDHSYMPTINLGLGYKL